MSDCVVDDYADTVCDCVVDDYADTVLAYSQKIHRHRVSVVVEQADTRYQRIVVGHADTRCQRSRGSCSRLDSGYIDINRKFDSLSLLYKLTLRRNKVLGCTWVCSTGTYPKAIILTLADMDYT